MAKGLPLNGGAAGCVETTKIAGKPGVTVKLLEVPAITLSPEVLVAVMVTVLLTPDKITPDIVTEFVPAAMVPVVVPVMVPPKEFVVRIMLVALVTFLGLPPISLHIIVTLKGVPAACVEGVVTIRFVVGTISPVDKIVAGK